jgi:hypothetical protein
MRDEVMPMALAKEKPLYAAPTDYEDDFESWSYEQAELLRQRRFAELDIPNLIEEIESMGSEQRFALQSSYRLVIAHLLKWQYQPQLRSTSWEITIGRERDNIAAREEKNHALRENARTLVEDVYRGAVREAAKETGLPRNTFPFDCPYTVDQLRDPEWMPD